MYVRSTYCALNILDLDSPGGFSRRPTLGRHRLFIVAVLRNVQVEEMRQRLEEKNRMIEKKTQAAMQAQQERNRMNTELTEIKDHMDIKDRKINVLQRKVSPLLYLFHFQLFLTEEFPSAIVKELRSLSFHLFLSILSSIFHTLIIFGLVFAFFAVPWNEELPHCDS